MASSQAVEADDGDEYAKLIRRMNSPRVVIDNDACETATVVRVDSANKHGILLELVQVLTDLNLNIKKAYITCDGSWFMDVLNVTDGEGRKIRDPEILNYIKTSMESEACSTNQMPSSGHTLIELTGSDRPGLLSEASAVLRDLRCNVVEAEVWTHNTRAAAVIHLTDASTHRAVDDPGRLAAISHNLRGVFRGGESRAAKSTAVAASPPPGPPTHTGRRLHRLMFDDRDYESEASEDCRKSAAQVTVTNCAEKRYTAVMVRCRDRPKLLFDTLCALADLQCLVFHGTVDAASSEAYQEYYIRHSNGLPLSSQAEQRRLSQCLRAAIERRASEGLELELQTEDRIGLLSDVTRTFRENGLCIRRAEIRTAAGRAVDTFVVSERSGESHRVDAKTVESVRRLVGQTILRVKQSHPISPPPAAEAAKGDAESSAAARFLLGGLFRGYSLSSFRLIRSYT